ncbi:imidazolonepropionase [Marinactinospora thermotolerans]|uniref:Imidazolonepropionase n=1 Tax=Marinactinospora thermotolerans DSM 45154 TaxID=1122192 RepID=A0A1T4S3K6_9ACTN|nr:imidazolonepropionase [Marinactinospora thermotolerans]SKA22401.1 imidazolonepropionase [Marinactinospora thermotolerans DSM 45154]
MTTTSTPVPRSLLVDRIGVLVTNDPGAGEGRLGRILDAALVVEEGRVAWTGPAGRAPAADARVDAAGRCVVPGFVDSHSHIVFAGDRGAEFAARMEGRAYEAGGIRSTVAATRAASDDALLARATELLGEARAQGTTTLEIKSGYGLTVADEERALRVAARLTEEVTFLGAHVVPQEYAADPAGYVDLVTGPMLRACAPHARWIDVFCERGAFDEEAARRVLTAGREHGLLARVHGNQLGPGPGVGLAVELGAASVDHCTYLDGADIAALADPASSTVATLLPGVDFSTRAPYPDARALLDAGATVALATDCNPGSCFSTSMALCIALAVREMRMTPDEALWAATEGGARALRRDDIGHLRVGARADLVLLEAPDPLYLAYRPGVPQVAAVWKDGERVAGRA